jgi:hypothetical protein
MQQIDNIVSTPSSQPDDKDSAKAGMGSGPIPLSADLLSQISGGGPNGLFIVPEGTGNAVPPPLAPRGTW